ncbi:MAG: transcriptional regulator [Rhodobacteraceae bacterium]|jgi:PII-like signaling protein|nr:transcriptional regulator [Paracoccaceae bacterium]
MQTYAKKRLEIIVEAPIQERLTALLDRLAVTGYTVLPALAGRGRSGEWSREGLVGGAGRMIVIVCLLDAERVDEVLEAVFSMVSRRTGIVSICDVQVVRPEHF